MHPPHILPDGTLRMFSRLRSRWFDPQTGRDEGGALSLTYLCGLFQGGVGAVVDLLELAIPWVESVL
ncbi:Cell number regulator 4 [Dissostichus eleginoides]|uniref:Cell number regulator 4 n=1 Tax=Dissostichus eleginoides TaxID=100907 RepID=A0AAD9BXF7_DISEL|nr:Cell number regulator 4 [Dissostichus eleginoides]